jgi:hypothetical protein
MRLTSHVAVDEERVGRDLDDIVARGDLELQAV